MAKLDRLARNAAFIANVLEACVEITASDMPEANRFLLQVTAAVAEHEAELIAERTRTASRQQRSVEQPWGWAIPGRAGE